MKISDNKPIYSRPFQMRYSFLILFQNCGEECSGEVVLKVLLCKYISGAHHWMSGVSLLRAGILDWPDTPTSVNLNFLE